MYHATPRTSADRVSPKLEPDRDLLPCRGRLRRGLPPTERYVPRRDREPRLDGTGRRSWDRKGFKPTERTPVGEQTGSGGSRVSDAQGRQSTPGEGRRRVRATPCREGSRLSVLAPASVCTTCAHPFSHHPRGPGGSRRAVRVLAPTLTGALARDPRGPALRCPSGLAPLGVLIALTTPGARA